MRRTVFSLLFLFVLAAAFAQSGYHEIKKIHIGGQGGWDYLIAQGGRVYVSHANEVDVVDSKTGEVAGKITDLKGVHGIALAPEFNRGFISNGQANSVTIFDLKTLQKIGEDVPTGGMNPDAIVYDPASKRVFAMNGRSADVTAIDAEKGTVAGMVKLEGKLEFAAPDGKGHLYVNGEDKSAVFDLDSRKLTLDHTWPLAPCESPSGMNMDRKSRRIFVGCHNKMMAVLNADTGAVVATPAICTGIDATWFDPETKYAFDSCGDGTLTIIHEDSPDKYSLVENVTTQRGARTMALDMKTHNIYLAVADLQAPPSGEAAPTGGRGPRPRPVPGTFQLLEFGR
jgi:DNA-binding beta-propeller fold protein YncE